jgi:hypothetical protein
MLIRTTIKRAAAVALSTVLLFSITTVKRTHAFVMNNEACSSGFLDVASSHSACQAIKLLAGKGVLNGYGDGTFRPSNPVTRAEFSKMLVATLRKNPNPARSLPFIDVSDHWVARAGWLQTAVAMNAISGYSDKTFRPESKVTRAELTKMVVASSGLPTEGESDYHDVRSSDWFYGWVGMAYRNGMIGPEAWYLVWTGPTFDGNAFANRGEAAIVLANLRVLDRSRDSLSTDDISVAEEVAEELFGPTPSSQVAFLGDSNLVMTPHTVIPPNTCRVRAHPSQGSQRGRIRVDLESWCLRPAYVTVNVSVTGQVLEGGWHIRLGDHNRTYLHRRYFVPQRLTSFEVSSSYDYAYHLNISFVSESGSKPMYQWWVNPRGDLYPGFFSMERWQWVPFPEPPYSPLRNPNYTRFSEICRAYYAKNGWGWRDGFHNHHIKPARWGGEDIAENCFRLPPSIHAEFTTWWRSFKTPLSQ